MGRAYRMGRRTAVARLALAAWLALFNLFIHGLHTCRLSALLLGERCQGSCPCGHGARPRATLGSAECAACHYLLGCPEAASPQAYSVVPDEVRSGRLRGRSSLRLPSPGYSPSCPRAPPRV